MFSAGAKDRMKRLLRRWLPTAALLLAGSSLARAAQQPDAVSIRRYSEEAQQALAHHDAGAALAALEKLARLTPGNASVYANLGAVYYTLGRYAPAAEAFERALRLDPKIPNVSLMLALCNAELGRATQALPVLEAAFRHPPSAEMGRTVGIKLAAVYSSLGQHLKALEVTEALLKRFPNDPELLYRASHLYGDRALETMTQLVGVAPESVWTTLAFGEALEAQKRYDLAVMQYRKVIAKDPAMAGAHYRLGRALLLQSPDSDAARDEALKEFQQELAVDPRSSAAEYETGEIYRRRGDFGHARDHFARAIQIDPSEEEAQIALARTLVELHEPQEAVTHLRAATRLNPKNEVSHFLLAAAYRTLADSADSEREMALYRKCHAEAAAAGQPSPLAGGEVTRQILDSEGPRP